jgi:cobalamin synthase
MDPTTVNTAVDTAQHALTFLSPAFVLAVLALSLMTYVATLIYKASQRTGAGEIFKQFATPQFVMSILLFFAVVMMIWIAFYGPYPVSNDMQVAIITAVIITGLQDLRKYWLNSTLESEKKNQTVASQADTINTLARGTGPGGDGRPS